MLFQAADRLTGSSQADMTTAEWLGEGIKERQGCRFFH
jgi:hypothetical protein